MTDDHFPDSAKSWALMNKAATRAMREQGYEVSRMPGRGRSNMWRLEKADTVLTASVRTTRDRWIAFHPLSGGSQWKTLDEADLVVVAAVDDRERPRSVEVYLFLAEEVRERFDMAYKARVEAGRQVTDNFGMWVALDPGDDNDVYCVGSGLAEKHPPVAAYPAEELIEGHLEDDPGADEAEPAPVQTDRPVTIAEVLAEARASIAAIAGVGREAVKLDLKIEY